MSLSSQIKVPAQVKGAVGGGSGGGATSLDGLSDVVITSAASGDFLRNNGSNFVNTPLSAADITDAGGALSSELATEASTRGSADTALAAPQYVCLANSGTLPNERVLTGTSNQVTITDNGANGTVVLSLPQNIHTAASPTFAGASLTGAIQATGTHSDPGATTTHLRRTSTGGWVLNTPTGSGFAARCNGADMILATASGITLSGGLSLSGSGGSGHLLRQSSFNGAISSGALVPGDMPHRLAIYRRITSDQAYAGSFAVIVVDYNQEAQDDGGDVSISGGVITFANTGRYRVTANFLLSSAAYLILPILNYSSGTSNFIEALDYTRTDGSYYFGQVSCVYDVTAADTLKICLQAGSSGNVRYTNATSVAGGKGNWVLIERLK